MTFYGIKELKGFVELESVRPNIDPDKSKDWDCIYDLKKEYGKFKFHTEFTKIEIMCDGFEIELNE